MANVTKKEEAKLSLRDLLDIEKAAGLICSKYEKSVTAWGVDTLREDYEDKNGFLVKYNKYKKIYDAAEEAIEKKLDEIEF